MNSSSSVVVVVVVPGASGFGGYVVTGNFAPNSLRQ
jgi:hypothetical protein